MVTSPTGFRDSRGSGGRGGECEETCGNQGEGAPKTYFAGFLPSSVQASSRARTPLYQTEWSSLYVDRHKGLDGLKKGITVIIPIAISMLL